MKDSEAIAKFADYLANIKNYSPNTVVSYRNDIEEFMGFIILERMAPNLLGLRNNRVCKNYVSYLSSKELASTSIGRKLSSLRSFYDFLMKNGVVNNNFFDDVEPPKSPKRLPKTIKTNEIMMLFNCFR